MTVADLIAELEGLDPDAKVRLATQPNWPLEHHISRVGVTDEGNVYIAEGSQVGYLSGDACEALGW